MAKNVKSKNNLEAIRNVIASSIGLTGDDSIWQSWLKLKKQEWRDLVALIRSNVKDEFKMRAIAVLLVPDYSVLPFKWQNEYSLKNSLNLRGHSDMFKISELPQKLRDFTTKLIHISVMEITTNWRHDKEVYGLLSYYNCYIIDCLKILPVDDPMAEQLFMGYQLNDPVVFDNMDYASGYNPLATILNAKIHEKWKSLASAKMHNIILAEESGQLSPRAGHEKALECYSRAIPIPHSNDEHLAYSSDLFGLQLQFILGFTNIGNRDLFQHHAVGRILRIIASEKYKALRHRFARHIIIDNTEQFKRFCIYDQEDDKIAKAMLAEFEFDKELASALKLLLVEAKKRFADRAYEESRKEIEVQQVLQQMT